MSEAWKQLDLEGGGLQSANLRLAALLGKRRTAFALLALFPLGLHRNYLRDRRGAWLYRTATLLCTGAYLAGCPLISQAAIAVLVACTIYEALRIDDAVAQVNKQLRMRVYLNQAPGTPLPLTAVRGNPRVASFAEQEKMLWDVAEIRGKTRE